MGLAAHGGEVAARRDPAGDRLIAFGRARALEAPAAVVEQLEVQWLRRLEVEVEPRAPADVEAIQVDHVDAGGADLAGHGALVAYVDAGSGVVAARVRELEVVGQRAAPDDRPDSKRVPPALARPRREREVSAAGLASQRLRVGEVARPRAEELQPHAGGLLALRGRREVDAVRLPRVHADRPRVGRVEDRVDAVTATP